RASRLCARPGDKLERMNCSPSRTTVLVFTIGAPLRSGYNARHEAHTASPLSSQAASPERGGATLCKLVDAMRETVEGPTRLFEGEGEREDAFRRVVGQG